MSGAAMALGGGGGQQSVDFGGGGPSSADMGGFHGGGNITMPQPRNVKQSQQNNALVYGVMALGIVGALWVISR